MDSLAETYFLEFRAHAHVEQHEGGAMVEVSAASVKRLRTRSTAFLAWFALLCTVCFSLTTVASGQLGIIWAGQVNLPASLATMGDLTGDSVPELIVATPDRVHIFQWDTKELRYIEHMNSGGFPAPIAALSVADATGDGQAELWVGMQGSGSIQLYALEGQSLVSRGSVGRLWSSVTRLMPVDMDLDGRVDLFALSEDGVAVVLRNTGQGFQQVWRTPADEPPEQFIAVGNYFDAGGPALVTAKAEGQVSVYQWLAASGPMPVGQPPGAIAKRHDNYPWGIVETIAMAPPQYFAHSDLYVATSQDLLYRYAWEAGSSRHVDQWTQEVTSASGSLKAVTLPDSTMLWLAHNASVLQAWMLDAETLKPVWQLTDQVAWFEVTPSGSLLVFGTDRMLRVVEPVAPDYIRVEKAGRGYHLKHPPVFANDEVFLSAQDFADLLGIRSWTTRDGTRLNGVVGLLRFFILDVGSDSAAVNGRSKPLSAAPRLVEGEMYVPLSLADALGFPYTWSAPLRHLEFN